ncbi:hypothetical protein [Flavobacterium sp. 3HN19-14]|uniref:hypothetical protein n=1 Tax=Flavobacterium sp. 3HN19-14 TaxID=3448133 RepID=UPI003EE10DA2
MIEDIYRDLIAKLLLTPVDSPYDGDTFSASRSKSFSHKSIGSINILYCKQGFILRAKYFKDKNKNRKALVISPMTEQAATMSFEDKGYFIDIKTQENIAMSSFKYRINLSDMHGNLFLEKEMYKKLFDDFYNRYPISVRRYHKILSDDNSFVKINYYFEKDGYKLSEQIRVLKSCNYILETQLNNVIFSINSSDEILSNLLDNYLEGASFIPYDLAERKITFAKAFENLKYYIEKHSNSSKKSLK